MDLTSGYPYSLINSGLPATYPKLYKPEKTEVVIIGGGISGALTAYYLVKAGVPCMLVDARTIGLGSTCASTSLLQYELDKPLSILAKQIGLQSAISAYKICAEAIHTLQKITQDIAFNVFEKQKSLFFAANAKDKKLIELEFLYRKRAGFKVHLLNEMEIKQQFGLVSPSGILSSEAATTDAYLLTHALLQKSIKKGLKVYDRTKIATIEYNKKGIKLITEKKITIQANKIVNATGYEVTEFIKKNIVQLSSTYVLASESISPNNKLLKEKTLFWNTAKPYLYMRSTTDNRIIIGGRDEKFYNPNQRDKLIKRKSNLLKRDFSKLFPNIEFIPEFSWSGTFGSTKDTLPYIGTYKKNPNTYYALGFGGNGITFSVIAAEIICNMILGKKKDNNVFLFSFERD